MNSSFLQGGVKEAVICDCEKYAKKAIDRAYFIILNKIDELDGANERLLKYYKEHIEKK
ncbi:MAG: hypothetical protein IKJ00_09525 [Clostridia bacterium]|nr:hypothetical protein [Clostridia bacterium]